MVDDLSKDEYEIDLTTVISEVNLVGSNPKEWWIDTGATRHVCSDKMMFSSFEPIETIRKGVHGELCHNGYQRTRQGGLEDDLWERADSNKCVICT